MIYVDESIQHDMRYICVALVYSPSCPNAAIENCLVEVGLSPGIDEYKSGAHMARAPHLQQLRRRLSEIVGSHCTIAVYIAPIDERKTLLNAVVTVAARIIAANNLPSPQHIYIDEGITGVDISPSPALVVHTNCNSKQVLGIQLADHAAYHCSLLLKNQHAGTTKTVVLDNAPHPYAGEEVELDWLVRLELRRRFFMEYRDPESIVGDDWSFKVANYGAFYSRLLPAELSISAHATFDEVYLGCVF